MVQQTIRWQQRFSNYRKALVKFNQAVELLSKHIEHEEIGRASCRERVSRVV